MNLDYETLCLYSYLHMRFLSLFLIVSLAFCYSGVCSATDFIADSAPETGSHCDMANHDDADNSDESQAFMQVVDTTDTQNSRCCFESLINSSIDDNLKSKGFAVASLLDFPEILVTKGSKYRALTFKHRAHGPPDIYISVSRFLL